MNLPVSTTQPSVSLRTTYPVMEHFLTLQGEGFHQGRAAYFIRLGGCDVGCIWCDVKDSWDDSLHPRIEKDNLVQWVQDSRVPLVVITGGEPLMHDLEPLTAAYRQAGIHTHLETSGAHPLSGHWDWICLSPKKFKVPLTPILARANELKVIVFNRSDLAWAEKYAQQVSADCLLYLQPEWDQSATMTPLIVEYIKQHPEWRLSMQVHKYINVP